MTKIKARLEEIKEYWSTRAIGDKRGQDFLWMIDQLEQSLALNAKYRSEAEKLWGYLDDISTYGDIYKPEINNYFKKVSELCEFRHENITSDGYILKWKALEQSTSSKGEGE